MALDGVCLHHLQKEIIDRVLDARVDKIYQPNREELVLTLKGYRENVRLLLCTRPDTARVQFTTENIENPAQPPMLCMLLRKKLGGAKLVRVEQPGLERVLRLFFDSVNELGDHVELSLVCEVMGRYSNVIFVDENGKVIDALKRVDAEMNSERLLLPGVTYRLPPQQEKLCLLSCSPEDICARLRDLPGDKKLNKALLDILQGVSPIVCRELEYRVLENSGIESVKAMRESDYTRLCAALAALQNTVINVSGVPHLVTQLQQRQKITADGEKQPVDEWEEKPLDVTFFAPRQYGATAKAHPQVSFSALLDAFYAQKDSMERRRVREQDLLKLLHTHIDRTARKIAVQTEELKNSQNRDTLRLYGDLLVANQYGIAKGAEKAELLNYYEESMPILTVPLDPALSAMQNAQKYYKEYRKAKTAQEKLTEQISSAREELTYLHSVLEELSRAQTEKELSEIRQELVQSGYSKARGTEKNVRGQKLAAIGEPLRFTTSDGFLVLVGKNNRQNDVLTLKTASNSDIWLHTKNIHGSHVILVTKGQQPSERALYEAAVLAAMHSGAAQSAQVPVDYTQVRHVSKPNGAKPGMVIYVQYKTLYADPLDGKVLGFV